MPRGRKPVMSVDEQIKFFSQELERLTALKEKGEGAAKKVQEFAAKLEKDTGFSLRSLDIVYVKKEEKDEEEEN